jgi:hypothetical protein
VPEFRPDLTTKAHTLISKNQIKNQNNKEADNGRNSGSTNDSAPSPEGKEGEDRDMDIEEGDAQDKTRKQISNEAKKELFEYFETKQWPCNKHLPMASLFDT